MRIDRLSVAIAVMACLVSAPAMAYVGPGAGLTLLSALWGLLVAVGAAVAFIVMWPIRRWRKRRQAAAAERTGVEAGDPTMNTASVNATDATPAAAPQTNGPAEGLANGRPVGERNANGR